MKGEESLIRQIRRNNQELGPLIEQLFEQKEGAGGSIGTERRTLLASQLWVKVRFITDDVNRLMETSGTRIVAAQILGQILGLGGAVGRGRRAAAGSGRRPGGGRGGAGASGTLRHGWRSFLDRG